MSASESLPKASCAQARIPWYTPQAVALEGSPLPPSSTGSPTT